MRISERTRYPHPVLRDGTGDYASGGFSVEVGVAESTETSKVVADYTVHLEEDALERAVRSGSAVIGVFVVCLRTYYNRLHVLQGMTGKLKFSRGELRGPVVFRPMICAVEPISDFTASSLHDDYSGATWDFRNSDVLAIGSELQFDVGLDKLTPTETIFELVTDNDVPEGQTRVIVDRDKIAIAVCENTHRTLSPLRQTSTGRVKLLNAVYLPAVMEVLSEIRRDGDRLEALRWHGVFSAKCTHLGITMTDPEPLKNAQDLLNSPLGELLAREAQDQ